VEEGPALGVALLAGVGAGVWSSVEEACDQAIHVVSTATPDPDRHATYRDYHAIYTGLYAALKDRFTEIAALTH
jgi:xylulokinase